jgi:hypothetical protein
VGHGDQSPVAVSGGDFDSEDRRAFVIGILYGSLEVIFGIGTITISSYSVLVIPFTVGGIGLSNSEMTQAAFQFLAGVYIMVRGLTNIEDGLGRGQLTIWNFFEWALTLVNLCKYGLQRFGSAVGWLLLRIDRALSESSKS